MKLEVFEWALGAFQEELSTFDPALVTTTDVARLFEVFTALAKTVSAGRMLLAPRAAEAGRWRSEGHQSAASWVAEWAGLNQGEAQGMLETSERLASLPETTDALKRGELSGAPVKEITTAAAENPATEGDLLEVAGRRSFKGLKEECRR